MLQKLTNFLKGQKKEESNDQSFGKLPPEAQLYLAAVANLQNHNYPTALQLFNRIIDSDNYGIDPEQDAGFHYNRSIAKSNLHDFDGAFKDLHKSISIFELAVANFEIFRLNEQLGKPNDGMDFLVRAYKMGHSNAEDVLRNNTNYFNR